jgi:biotin-independent malonate decarboxylase gamma subunit
MKQERYMLSRGQVWFEALTGNMQLPASDPASVWVADGLLQHERVRYLAVVPDPNNRFPRARHGEVGVIEGWTLAKYVREVCERDRDGDRRAIVAIVDIPSQAYGRNEELLAIHLACAAAADAYASARLVGHPVVALIVGHALSGGFLAHGYQANRILALDDPGVLIHAMGKEAAARVTRRSVAELDALATKVLPLSYDVRAFARLGIIHKLIEGVNVEAPTMSDIRHVQDELLAAIADARSGPCDLSNRLTSVAARTNRAASVTVRERMALAWN